MKQVNQNPSSRNNNGETDWQILGEIELPVGSNADFAISAWLTELLGPLNLSRDFLHKVLESAQGSAMRTLLPNAAMALGNIHLSVLATQEYLSKGETWGFFHIERIKYQVDGIVAHDYIIDFYLYVEGE